MYNRGAALVATAYYAWSELGHHILRHENSKLDAWITKRTIEIQIDIL